MRFATFKILLNNKCVARSINHIPAALSFILVFRQFREWDVRFSANLWIIVSENVMFELVKYRIFNSKHK